MKQFHGMTSCCMRCLVFAIHKVSSLDVEGDRVSGFELVQVPHEILILVLGWSFPGCKFGILA